MKKYHVKNTIMRSGVYYSAYQDRVWLVEFTGGRLFCMPKSKHKKLQDAMFFRMEARYPREIKKSTIILKNKFFIYLGDL